MGYAQRLSERSRDRVLIRNTARTAVGGGGLAPLPQPRIQRDTAWAMSEENRWTLQRGAARFALWRCIQSPQALEPRKEWTCTHG
jgi:hypothetical protein